MSFTTGRYDIIPQGQK